MAFVTDHTVNGQDPGPARDTDALLARPVSAQGLGQAQDTQSTKDDDNMAQWAGQPNVKGSSESMRMALLTFSIIGLQFTWGIEMTYCTPYLLSLGLTKSRTAFVWIAGPLSGLVMQPIVGVISDRTKSKYGRRRPFMVIGSLIVAASMIVMGWTKEIVTTFIKDEDTAKTLTIVLAVLSIYAIDFSINAVQACCRCLVVDTLPIPKQQLGSAWASRMSATGHLIGYAAGTLDLVAMFGTRFGDTQFKKMTLIAGFGLILTVGVTSWAVTERVLISGKDADSTGGVVEIVGKIWTTTLHLPARIQAICWVQFWSWIGWFPFLFYSSTWVGETYFKYDRPHDIKHSDDALGDIGRIGSMALVVFSTVTFMGAYFLPLFVRAPDEDKFTPRPPSSIAALAMKINENKPDLLTAWFFGHLMFAFAMFLAPFAHSFRFATVLVGFCGLPWAIACWAPGTFLGVEVNKISSKVPTEGHRRQSREGRDDSPDLEQADLPSILRVEHGADDGVASTGELSGIYFGILNIYSTLPQFIATFISMIVFAIFEPVKIPESVPKEYQIAEGPNSIAVCLFIGAFSAVGAAYATIRLKYIE